MFDGDQLHQFIASRTSSLPIIPLSFPLNGNPLLDPYSSSSSSLHSQIIHQESPKNVNIEENKLENPLISTTLVLETERSMDPWSHDEVFALLKLRSSMEIWFPDFTWEHISRKLGELGYKKSAEQCKEKFEEESRSFNTVSSNKNNNIFSELDELYPAEKGMEKVYKNHVEENPSPKSDDEVVKKPLKSSKKRKRSSSSSKEKLEMFKGFCEAFVTKMMAQQEEMHSQMIEHIVKRDEAKIAREEAWKNQEMDRMKKEIEIRANEQENAAKRQGKIIEFLKKFTCEEDRNLAKKIITSNSCSTSVCNNSTATTPQIASNKDVITAQQNPSSLPSQDPAITTPLTSSPSPSSNLGIKDSEQARTSKSAKTHLDLSPNYERGGDTGKRWPRDEVLALINLRCKMSCNNGDENNKDATKGPLWERISQGMSELGYNRSAKRCKEKWENINKYFRKTKDSNKKRAVDSRTCPYFHQLSSLYSEGTHNQ